jgi:hypothetical protein
MEELEIKPEQVGWNLAQFIVLQLSELLHGASTNYISGNYIKAFSYLRALRLRITPVLSIDERTNSIKKEKEIFQNISIAISKGFISTEQNQTARERVFILYGDYNDFLMDLLKKYNFYVPTKEDRTNLN